MSFTPKPRGTAQMSDFEISLPNWLRTRIRELAAEADIHGGRNKFLRELSKIAERLKKDPFSCGEPTHDLHHAGVTVHLVMSGPTGVEFLIYPEHRLVVLQHVTYSAPS